MRGQPEKNSQDCQDMTVKRLWDLELRFQCYEANGGKRILLFSFTFDAFPFLRPFFFSLRSRAFYLA
jgi:hypothetical protein